MTANDGVADDLSQPDAIVMGGGLSGLAAALHLARGGLRVVCLEPRAHFPSIIGESLDWSAPDLLRDLIAPMEDLVDSGAATYKRHITLSGCDGESREYLPDPSLAGPPLKVEVRTLHLDRLQIHERLTRLAALAGVRTIHEKVVGYSRTGRRLNSIQTESGRILQARWYVDASGAAASLLAREFQLRSIAYGPRKVALWGHCDVEDWREGTNLYAMSGSNDYMQWAWEIPIRPGVSSLGFVASGDVIKKLKHGGRSNAEIFIQQLSQNKRLAGILRNSVPHDLSATSFHCRSFVNPCGENWVVIGEAASQADPITGNGVTAALRQADEASALILAYRQRPAIPALDRAVYNLRVLSLGRFFNSLIEKIYYQPALRRRLGLHLCGRVYTVPAWSMNLVYSRLRPRRLVRTLAFCAALASLRAATSLCFHVSDRLDRQSAQRRRERGHNALQRPR